MSHTYLDWWLFTELSEQSLTLHAVILFWVPICWNQSNLPELIAVLAAEPLRGVKVSLVERKRTVKELTQGCKATWGFIEIGP